MFVGPVLLYQAHDKDETDHRGMYEDSYFLKDVPLFLNALTEEVKGKLKTFHLV